MSVFVIAKGISSKGKIIFFESHTASAVGE